MSERRTREELEWVQYKRGKGQGNKGGKGKGNAVGEGVQGNACTGLTIKGSSSKAWGQYKGNKIPGKQWQPSTGTLCWELTIYRTAWAIK